MADAPVVPARVRALATQVGDPTPMRRGSLTERYVKCSKPGCRCADEAEARHGPYYSLTRTVAGIKGTQPREGLSTHVISHR